MRKVLTNLLLLLVVGFATEVITFDNNWAENPLFNVVSENPNGIEIVFSMHKMVIEENLIDGIPMKTYGVPGIFLPNDEGAPNLARTGKFIAIPQGSQAKVTILISRTEVYHNIEIAPAPNIPLDSDDSPLRYEKNTEIYSRNAYYPDSPVKLSEPMQMRGVDVVILGITPLQYNPVTKELIVYKDVRVRVDFIGGNGHFGEDRLRSRFWEPILEAHLLNYNSLPRFDFYEQNRQGGSRGYEYIIIVPDDATFEAWADSIKAFRNSQGISTEVFTLSDIGGSSASAIENFLNNAYNNWDPAPAAFLLLGDYPQGSWPSITSPYWNSYCVSDNIYADVDGNGLPDMHHGRICARTEQELRTMINKTLRYERNPSEAQNFWNNPLVACGWQTERWFQLCVEVIRGFFVSSLGKNPVRQYAIYSGSPTAGCAWSTAANTATVVNYFSSLGYIPTTNQHNASWWSNGSASGINAAINSGAFLVQHRDHGSVDGWGEPDYHIPDLEGLNITDNMFPFVYSTNCHTGQFDEVTSFAEKFHRKAHGALGVNAASQTSYSFVNDTYIWGTYDALWPEFMPDNPGSGVDSRPCMAMTSGKYFLTASSWPSNPEQKEVTYYLFHHHGDAFITLDPEPPSNDTLIIDTVVTHDTLIVDTVVIHDDTLIWIPPAPKLTSISHHEGLVKGNDIVTLYGENFFCGEIDYTVKFGGVEAVIINCISLTEMQVRVPAHARSLVDVTIKDEFGRASVLADAYRYVELDNIALGDVDADGVDEIVIGAAPGREAKVMVYKYTNGSFVNYTQQFNAYNPSFLGGVHVACGDVINNLVGDEIITGAGFGGGPHVRVFSGTGALLNNGFMAYNTTTTGVRVGVGDVDGDYDDEIITGAGPGGGPHVRAFEGNGDDITSTSFFAFDQGLRSGIFVAGGNFQGDVSCEIVAGLDEDEEEVSCVHRFDATGNPLIPYEIKPYGNNFHKGVNVVCGNLDNDSFDELVTGACLGGGPHVCGYQEDGSTIPAINFSAKGSPYCGVNVAIGSVDGVHSHIVTISYDKPDHQSWLTIYEVEMNGDLIVGVNTLDSLAINFGLSGIFANNGGPNDGTQSQQDFVPIPEAFALEQCYPNPFRSGAKIGYALPKITRVHLRVFDVSGQEIKTLDNSVRQAGYYYVIWDGLDDSGRKVSSGVYFYQLEAGDFKQTNKVTVVR